MALHQSFSDKYEELPYPQEYDFLWTEERYAKFEEIGARVFSPSWWLKDRQGVIRLNPLLVAIVVGVTYSALLLLAPLVRPKLQNDPMCGIPTGGQVLELIGNQHNMIFVFFRWSAGGTVKSYPTLCLGVKLSSTPNASRTALGERQAIKKRERPQDWLLYLR